MDQRKPGKTVEYSESQLKKILSKYREKHKCIIKLSVLEKVTGISRKTWKRRMGKVIDELNQIVTIQSTKNDDSNLPIPNVDLIIDKFSNNPQGLRDALFHLNEVILKIYDENIRLQETLAKKNKIVKTLKLRVEKMEKEKGKLSSEVDYYERVMIESMNPSMRKEAGMKNNLIEINKHNQESAASLEIEEEFPELFEDNDDE